MSILDDAIREHLELKRAHGADEVELKRLEDEAFGPPGRPEDELDPFAEAPTQFLGEAATDLAEAPPEGGRRIPNITDLQEPPSFPIEDTAAVASDAEAVTEAPPTGGEAKDEAGAPPEADASGQAEAPPEAPSEEQHPAMEHEVPAPPPAEPTAAAEPDSTETEQPAPAAEASDAAEISPSGPGTEEREAIAEQPTQFFDVEAELTADGPDTADRPTPTDEQLLDSQLNEPRLAPVEPLEPAAEEEPPAEPDSTETERPAPAAGPAEPRVADEAPSEEYEEDDFFSEQRLSDELNQALEAPVTDEHEALPEHEPFREPEPPEPTTPPLAPRTEEATAIYDFEEDAEGEAESGEQEAHEPGGEHEDVLEDTPDFLEESPDDDDLWFEQRPPKDFDFDD